MTDRRDAPVRDMDAVSETNGDGGAQWDAIQADIDETRREMGNTLTELGDRLEPGHLVDQAKNNLRDATIGRVEESVRGTSEMVLDTIKRNPIPSALAGVGLAMLWKNRNQTDQRGAASYRTDYGYPSRPASMYDGPRSEGLGAKAADAAAGVGETITGAATAVGGTVGGAASAVAGGAQQATGQVVDLAGETAQQVGWKLDNFMQANPLAMGAIAVGVGAVAASLLPTSQPERGMLGDASRQLSSAVRDTVQDVSATAEQMADEAESAPPSA